MNKRSYTDPFFSQIIFKIESCIRDADVKAAGSGLALKDSHIKSCLSKVKMLARGSKPKSEPQTERDKFLMQLAQDIDAIRKKIRLSHSSDTPFDESKPLPVEDWLIAIKGVVASLNTRSLPGTRCYLDFLEGFIGNVR